MVGKPAGREREHAEGNEGGAGKRDQLAIGPLVDHFEPDHDGREDQQDEVVERVRPVQEADGKPFFGFGVAWRSGSFGHLKAFPAACSV